MVLEIDETGCLKPVEDCSGGIAAFRGRSCKEGREVNQLAMCKYVSIIVTVHRMSPHRDKGVCCMKSHSCVELDRKSRRQTAVTVHIVRRNRPSDMSRDSEYDRHGSHQ